MKLRIKQKHIDQGVRNCRDGCPIALAAKEQGLQVAEVSYRHIYIRTNNKHPSLFPILLKATATKFVCDFDAGRPVKPFTTTIDL